MEFVMQVTKTRRSAFLALLLASTQVGCITTPDKNLLQSNVGAKKPTLLERLPLIGKKKASEMPEPYPNPVKIAATWTPDTLIQTGRTPTRGFGGRVFFYDEKSRPVPVEGTLTVHGFDDSAETADEGVKRFVFTPEQFTRHFGQSDLGASYSIWIPWDAVGGDQRRISLVTSFQTSGGQTVQGIPATLLLPGKNTDLRSPEEFSNFAPQYQAYLNATQTATSPTTGLTTTTIRRRRPDPATLDAKSPAISIPSNSSGGDLIAGRNGTRSFDLDATVRDATVRNAPVRNAPARPTGPRRATVLPASAEMPLQ
jgi:hypothetical protein